MLKLIIFTIDIMKLKEGSIKLTVIDDITIDKKIYIDKCWKPACKTDKCIELLYKNDLCEYHHRKTYEGAERGDIRIIEGRKMKWDGFIWNTVCSIKYCKKTTTNGKLMCKQHVENPKVYYSSFNNSIQMFNDISDEFYKNKQRK